MWTVAARELIRKQMSRSRGEHEASCDLLRPAVAPQEVPEQGPVVRLQQRLRLPAVLQKHPPTHIGSAPPVECTHRPPTVCTVYDIRPQVEVDTYSWLCTCRSATSGAYFGKHKISKTRKRKFTFACVPGRTRSTSCERAARRRPRPSPRLSHQTRLLQRCKSSTTKATCRESVNFSALPKQAATSRQALSPLRLSPQKGKRTPAIRCGRTAVACSLMRSPNPTSRGFMRGNNAAAVCHHRV